MVMSGICMTKCIREIVVPRSPPLFKLYVDDGYSRQKKETQNEFHDALNSFNPKLKFTVENEPPRFLDSEFVKNDETRNFSLKVFHKPNKFPMHWSSQTPRRYKKNAIIGDLHRALLISDDFDGEVSNIRERYSHAGFPHGFVNTVIKDFEFSRFQRLIPERLFQGEDTTPILRVRLPFCQKNENLARTFLKRLYSLCRHLLKPYCLLYYNQLK